MTIAAPARSDFQALASLLQDIAPQALAALRIRFPHQASLFSPAHVLGSQDAQSGVDDIEALSAFAKAGVEAAGRALEAIINTLGKRIKRARNIKLLGSVVTSVSSAGVVSALMLSQPQTALAVALISFGGSVASLVGEHMSQPLAGNQKSLGELLGDALGAEAKVRDLRLTAMATASLPREETYALASRVNAVATSPTSPTGSDFCDFRGVRSR
jgi:hypothetical protein